MYRDDDEATRARAEVLVGRYESAEAALQALAVPAGPAYAVEPLAALPVGLTGPPLRAFVEAAERAVRAMERELARVEATRAASQVRPSAPSGGLWPAALRDAFMRHLACSSRLQRIAPLVLAARAGREEARVDPASLLGRRTSLRDWDEPGAADRLAERLHAMRDAAERELERLGLADATGLGVDRARDAMRVHALLVEFRYERLARRTIGEAYEPEAELSGSECERALDERSRRYLVRAARIPASLRDALDEALADLALAWFEYTVAAASAAVPSDPLPEVPDLTRAAHVRAGASAVRAAAAALPAKSARAAASPLAPSPAHEAPLAWRALLPEVFVLVRGVSHVVILLLMILADFDALAPGHGERLRIGFFLVANLVVAAATCLWAERASPTRC